MIDFSTSKKYVTISSSGQNFEELGKYSFKYDNLENIVMRRNSRNETVTKTLLH